MVNENLVTVSNNVSNIDVSIIANTNTTKIAFDNTMEVALATHNTATDAHDNRFSELITQINNQLSTLTTNINSELALKSDTSTSYTKTEVDTALSAKLDISNLTITKQGNTFNGANQLLQLDNSGSIPTALKTDVSGKANINADNFSKAGKATLTHFAFPSNLNFISMTVPTSGGTITAPDDGYINLSSVFTGNICLQNTSISVNSSGVYFSDNQNQMGSQCHIPVTKGNIIKVFHQGTSGTYLHFIYANGGT